MPHELSSARANCAPWPCAPGRVCAAHAPEISVADAGPLIAVFASVRCSAEAAPLERAA